MAPGAETSASQVATADEVDPETLVRPVWGSRWTLPEAREILIGPKQDDFCFIVFPGDDSVCMGNRYELTRHVIGGL